MSRRNTFGKVCALGLLLSIAGTALGKPLTLYVAPNGNDAWTGLGSSPTRRGTNGPLATLPAALERARAARQAGSHPQILLRTGTYRLGKPLQLTGLDSGQDAKNPFVIGAFPKEQPVISSETPITGWHTVSNRPSLWQAEIPAVREGQWYFRELFVNGKRKQRARTPNSGYFRIRGESPQDHPAALKFRPGNIKAKWAQSGEVEVVALLAWADFRMFIRSVDKNNCVARLSTSPRPSNRERNARYFIENAPDLLDSPGEWYLDRKTGILSYWPEPGEDLTTATVTAPQLTELLMIQGTKEQPVNNVVLHGLTFADTDWSISPEGYADTQAAIDVHGCIQAQWAHNCAIDRCRFTRLGGYAVDFNAGCQSNRIVGNEMSDLGGGGVRLGHPSVAVGQQQPTGHNQITDNHIHHIGLVYPPAIGVFLLHTGTNVIAHNHIHHTYYSAVSVGWSWGYSETPCRGNIVQFNHLHDIGQFMLSDMGGVYLLGVQPGTVVRNNLIHDVNSFTYGGWGLYTDEGSTDMLLENNIVYGCKAANFHQHYGKGNVVRNNIFAFGKDYQIMRTRPESHVSFFLTNNIIYFDSGEVLGNNWSGTNYVIDHNVYFDTRVGTNGPLRMQGAMTFEDWRKEGHDLHSIIADPLFVNPKAADFRLRHGSPARKLGFKPIDLSEVGIRQKLAPPVNR